jgi:hypothetical protein
MGILPCEDYNIIDFFVQVKGAFKGICEIYVAKKTPGGVRVFLIWILYGGDVLFVYWHLPP